MDELTEALQRAQTNDAIGDAIVQAANRHIGLSAFYMLRLSGPVISPADAFAVNGRAPVLRAREDVVETLALFGRELESFGSLTKLKSFDIAARYPPDALRRTEILNAFWIPLRVQRQMIGILRTSQEPVGFIDVCRAHHEPAFTARDLATFETIRSIASRTLFTEGATRGSNRLEDALAVLSTATTEPWLLFDSGGQLLWLNDEARARLSVAAARIGSRVVLCHSDPIGRLRAWVRAGARTREMAVPGEHFVARRFEFASGRPLFLIGLAAPPPAKELRAARLARRHALTRRQSEVLIQLATGKANKTIAAILGCAESTVELHVTALLSRLDCENRAELVARFWTS
jgi:DNA-binding NarL/FixJ family response regulator